jgi:NADPH-dependent 2,4-dienoyl-CoA reductase/sulfur reductase-like enzyme
VPDWHALAHRTLAEIEGHGITLLLNLSVEALAAQQHRVLTRGPDGKSTVLHYDRVVIATGAAPIPPNIHGHDLPGVFVLHTMTDSFRVQDEITTHQPRHAVVVGGGYIGLEMADALTRRGLHVTVLQTLPVYPDAG